MIGLIAAMPVEAELLMSQMKDTKVAMIGRHEYKYGTLFGQTVVISISGPGKVNAAICATSMIQNFKPSYVINFGVAGSLDPMIGLGDLVIAKGVVQHDINTTCLGDPLGLISGINMKVLSTDGLVTSSLIEASEPMIPQIHMFEGVIATGDQFLHDAGLKIMIHDRFDSLAVDMETGAIAHACYMHYTPFGAVRCISDRADSQSDSDYETSLSMSAINAQNVVANLLQNHH